MLPACEIYAKELWPLGHGHPMWGPEPCTDFGEVRLGDVGYLRRGHFCFLFNTMRCADDPINARRGVPPEFEVFSPPDSMLRHHPNEITQTQLHSRSIQSVSLSASVGAGSSAAQAGASASVGLRYHCKEDSGALLLLKRPGHRTYLDCDLHIKRYIGKHIASWYEFANAHLGIGLEEKDIIFVSGFTKTTVWAEAVFNNDSVNGELCIAGGCFAPPVAGEFRVSMSRCMEASVFSRVGPPERVLRAERQQQTPEPDEEYDQCIFLNYHKMKRRKLLRPKVMRAAAGPHKLPEASDDESPSSLGSMGSYSDALSDIINKNDFDPVNDVLDYILQTNDTQAACASDADLRSLFSSVPTDIEHALQRLSPEIVRDEGGLGILAPAANAASTSDHRTGHMPAMDLGWTSPSPSSSLHNVLQPWSSATCRREAMVRQRGKNQETRTGNVDGGGGGIRWPSVQVRKSKERHASTRPALQRLHVQGPASEQKVDIANAKKNFTFIVGSVPSNGSRSARSTKATDKKMSETARPSSPTAKTAATSNRWNIKQTNASVAADADGPGQRRRGIVIRAPLEYETDADDDSEWASDHSSEDKANAAEDARLREAAEEAQRQRDMFAKVPKRSYSNVNRPRPGLLSQMLNHDPNILPGNYLHGTSQSTQDVTHIGRQAVAPTVQTAAQVPVAPTAPKCRHDGGYRPKGRPQGEELEDTESDDDGPDDTIQVSHRETGRPPLPSVATAPIPMTHPYNLPPAIPMTPRTTRQQMLQTELSESLRRNLLWERQVSRINLTGRRAGVPGSGLRPLTVMNGEAPSVAPQPGPAQALQQAPQQAQNGDDKVGRRRRTMVRSRSWADE